MENQAIADGGKQKSATVPITRDGQVENVVLAYEIEVLPGSFTWVNKNNFHAYAEGAGSQHHRVSGSHKVDDTGISLSIESYQCNGNNYMETEEKVDLTGCKTIMCEATNMANVSIGIDGYTLRAVASQLDVSQVKGEHTICVGYFDDPDPNTHPNGWTIESITGSTKITSMKVV